MTDVQILTLALTLLGVFAGSWFNNSRIGDVKDVLRAEMKQWKLGSTFNLNGRTKRSMLC